MCRDVTKKELFTSVSLVLRITFGRGDEKSTQADSHSRNFQVHDGGAKMMGGKMSPLFKHWHWIQTLLLHPPIYKWGRVCECVPEYFMTNKNCMVSQRSAGKLLSFLCWLFVEVHWTEWLVCSVQAATGLITTLLMGCYWIDGHRKKAQLMLHKESRKA